MPTIREHENLIWKVISDIDPQLEDYDTEDWYQVGLMALDKATKTYNPNRSAFSTYAYLLIKRAILNILSSRETKKTLPEDIKLSLDQIIENDENGAFELHEHITKYKPPEHVKQELLEFIAQCVITDREKAIVKHLIGGYDRKTLAKILKISYPREL